MAAFSIKYIFEMVDRFSPMAKQMAGAAQQIAGSVTAAGNAANGLVGSAARTAAALANQASAAQNAGRAMAGYADATATAASRAAAAQRVMARDNAWMAAGYTRGPNGQWVPPSGGRGGGTIMGSPGADRAGGMLALGGFLSYFTGWGRNLFKTNLEFEKEFNNAKAVMAKSSPDEMLLMRQRVLELSKNSVFKPTEIMRAAGELGSAGYEARDVMNALPTALKMAQAGREPIDKMAEMMVAVRNQFGLGDTPANNLHVGNVLAETARQTMAKFSDMKEAFKMAGPFAEAAGVDLETTAAMIGALSQKGIKGSLAGTGIRRFESGFLKDNKISRGFLAKYGIDPRQIYGADGKMKHIIGTIALLEKKGVKAGDAMKALGDRGGPILQALLQTGSAALRKYVEDLRNSQGSLDKMDEAQMEGLPGAWNRLISALQRATIKIGESGFTKDIENATNWMTQLVERFAAAPEWMQRTVGGAGVLAGALAALAMPVALLTFSLRTLGITAAVSSMATLAANLFRAATAARLLMGITGLGAALYIAYEIYENWDRLAAAMERVAAAAKALASGDFKTALGIAAEAAKPEITPEVIGLADRLRKAFGLDPLGGGTDSRYRHLDQDPTSVPQSMMITSRFEGTFQPATVTVQGNIDASGLLRLNGTGSVQANDARGTSSPEVTGGAAGPSTIYVPNDPRRF